MNIEELENLSSGLCRMEKTAELDKFQKNMIRQTRAQLECVMNGLDLADLVDEDSGEIKL